MSNVHTFAAYQQFYLSTFDQFLTIQTFKFVLVQVRQFRLTLA